MSKGMMRNFLFSLVMALLLIIAAIWGCYRFTADHIHAQNEKAAEATIAEAVRQAQKILDTQKNTSLVVTNHDDIIRFMTGTVQERMDLRTSVRSLLTNGVSFSSGAVMAYLYSAEGNWISSTDSSSLESSRAFRLSRLLAESYHLEISFRNSIITDCFSFDDTYYYAIISPIFQPVAVPRLSDYEGSLIMIYRADCLIDAIPSSDSASGFIREDCSFLGGSKLAYERWLEGDAEGVSQSIAERSWTIELVMNTESDLTMLRHLRVLCWVVALAATVALTVLTINQYHRIVQPILELANQVANVKHDGDLLIAKHPQTAELEQLTNAINNMLQRVNQLNGEVVQMKMKYYEEQIAFFQAQINPHFLFNTFECIRGMASDGKMEEVRTAASCMAGIYRYCAVKTPLVPLQMEYDCLKQYMRVMQLRYGDVYRLDIQSDEESLQQEVPRMCLQPFVENSITHGFQTRPESEAKILITSAAEDGVLFITLEDSGIGMTEDKLAYYNASQPVHIDGLHSHIGITNVVTRFNLLFPNRCKITFAKSEMGGLKIVIQLQKLNK